MAVVERPSRGSGWVVVVVAAAAAALRLPFRKWLPMVEECDERDERDEEDP